MMLNAILTHQRPSEVAAMLAAWRECVPADSLLVVYGGPAESFAQIAHRDKIFVNSQRLRTRDHQREKQSYADVYQGIAEWLADRDFTHVHFAEFDHLPLVPDLNQRQLQFLEQEKADVIGYRVRRVDGTNYPNYLYHAADARFASLWQAISQRTDPSVVLRMFGTGCVWTRAAFDVVAARPEPFPIYLELYLSTLAHHLGFRVRDIPEQNRFVRNLGEFAGQIEQVRREGAWTLHPVKSLWSRRAGRVDAGGTPGSAGGTPTLPANTGTLQLSARGLKSGTGPSF